LAYFIQRYFGGTQNESLDPKQLELLLAGLEPLTTTAPEEETKVPARAERLRLPAHLETERVVLEPGK
jgi:hypothetical protein